MKLRPLTAGAVSGTGTLVLEGHPAGGAMFGGALISADGTNTATVVVRENNADGAKIFEVQTKTSLPIYAPFDVPSQTNTLHYSVSGTNAVAQFAEWVY